MNEYQEENNPNSLSDRSPSPEALSLSDKFVGILTEPSSTFAHIRATGPRTVDWLIPVLLMSIILGLSMFVRFSNPETAAQMMQQQEVAIQKQVDEGKMTQEQADQVHQQMAQFAGFTRVFASLGAVLGYAVVFFILCLLYWLLVRFVMKGEVTFSFILSVVGLAAFITAIDQIIALLLMVLTNNAFANLSPALLFGGDPQSMSFRILLILAPLAVWAQYVIGVGFAKVANISVTKGMIAAFLVWGLFASLTVFTGFGA